jgi:hypothetical protein
MKVWERMVLPETLLCNTAEVTLFRRAEALGYHYQAALRRLVQAAQGGLCHRSRAL